jgi:hypothetical protein
VSLSVATAYLEHSLRAFDAWSDQEPDDQLRALIEATRDITVLPFSGQRTAVAQALAWPRSYAVNPDLEFNAPTIYFDDDIIPKRITDATIELAYEYLVNALQVKSRTAPERVLTRTKVDILEKEWKVVGGAEKSQPTGMLRFPRVVDLLYPLLGAGGALEIIRV